METTANTDFVKEDPKRIWIGLICLTVACLGGYLLYRDYQMSSSSNGDVLATIERKDLKVRKRPSSSFVWQDAGIKQDVHRKEYIQTGEGSAAIVRFSNGKVLELGENSLILVDNIEDLTLSFLKGTGLVKENGKDSKITKDETGLAKLETLPVQLLKPENLDTLLAQNDTVETDFSWGANGTLSKNTIIEISSGAEFKGKTLKITSINPAMTKIELKKGKYFWRVMVDGSPASAVKQFSVIQLPRLNPISPKNTQVSVLSSRTQILFKWDNSNVQQEDSRAAYQLELSDDESFKNPSIYNIDPKTGFLNISKFEKGIYFWRIKSSLGEKNVTGTVAKVEVKPLQEVEITVENIQSESVLTLDQKKQIQVSWRSSVKSEELKYVLSLKQLSTQGLEKKLETTETTATISNLTPGYFEFSVSAKVGTKSIGQSKSIKVTLLFDEEMKIISPLDNAKFEYWDDVPQIKISWQKDALVDQGYHYLIEIAEYQGFEKTIYSENLKSGTSFTYSPKMKSNHYFWRLKLLNPEEHVVKLSKVHSFQVQHFPTLDAPTHLAIDSSKLERPTLFWNGIPSAKKYSLQVVKVGAERSSNVVLEKEVSETKLELTGLNEGDYQYSVQAIDPLGRKGAKSEFKKFNVSYGSVLEAPESLTEEVQ